MHFDETLLKSVLLDAELVNSIAQRELNFSIDSRDVNSNEIFVALEGLKFDGHNFLKEALENGAIGLMIKKSKKDVLKSLDDNLLKSKLLILVEDTFESIIALAENWRSRFSCSVIAVTGSVGKTSTKNIIGNIISKEGKDVLVSKGNQNTLLGVALNILRMRENLFAAVFEVGINKRGEMAKIATLLNPTIAVITCIGHSHMEGLGSLVDISSEKRCIFKNFKENSIGIINGDDSHLANIGYAYPVIKFGYKTTNQIQARKIKISTDGINFILKIYNQKFNIKLNTFHEGHIYNSLAATAVACVLNIPYQQIVYGITKPLKIKGRFQNKKIIGDRGTLIDDCYNANPESVKSALIAFEQIETSFKKVIVLSDMNELGEDSAFWHRQIGRFLRKIKSVSHVILVGKMVECTKTTLPLGVRVDAVATWNEALFVLKALMAEEKLCILIKGSTFGYTDGLACLVKTLSTEDDIMIHAARQEKRAQI